MRLLQRRLSGNISGNYCIVNEDGRGKDVKAAYPKASVRIDAETV
jgi:hypothetical protein